MALTVETIKSDHEVLIRCSLCGSILDRVTVGDWLKDQAFARTMYRLASRHQASCLCDKSDPKPCSSVTLESAKSARANGSLDKD